VRFALFLAAWIAATSAGVRAEEARPVVVGLVPSEDPAITTALAQGIRLAFEETERSPSVELVVGRNAGQWSTAASTAVDLVFEKGAIALVSPPERRTAHLLAQVGSRSHVPVISTSPAASVTQAGSVWVWSVAERREPVGDEADAGVEPPYTLDAADPDARSFVEAFRKRHARAPGAWSAVGYDAGRVLVEALAGGESDRETVNERLASGRAVRGATGTIRFDARGNRRPAAARAEGAEAGSDG
jgi:ABC-type branched-subunit amino acid transport system substrate-binding protein